MSKQVNVLMHPRMKGILNNLAQQKNCSVPDVIREAIEEYLEKKGINTNQSNCDRTSFNCLELLKLVVRIMRLIRIPRSLAVWH